MRVTDNAWSDSMVFLVPKSMKAAGRFVKLKLSRWFSTTSTTSNDVKRPGDDRSE